MLILFIVFILKYRMQLVPLHKVSLLISEKYPSGEAEEHDDNDDSVHDDRSHVKGREQVPKEVQFFPFVASCLAFHETITIYSEETRKAPDQLDHGYCQGSTREGLSLSPICVRNIKSWTKIKTMKPIITINKKDQVITNRRIVIHFELWYMVKNLLKALNLFFLRTAR